MSEMTGAGLPKFSDDPVVDFCVREVIAVAVGAERKIAEKDRERDAWKQGDTKHLESVGG